MTSKDGRSLFISKFLLTTGTIALTATSIALVASGIALNNIENEPKTSVNFEPISWLFKTSVGLDQSPAPKIGEIEFPEFKPVALLKISHFNKNKVYKKVIATNMITDQIRETRSAPISLPVVLPQVAPQMKAAPAPEKFVDEDEMVRMQQIHKMIHMDFIARLDSSDLMDAEAMNTQLAIHNAPPAESVDANQQVDIHVTTQAAVGPAPAVLVAEIEEVSVAPVVKKVIYQVIKKIRSEKAKRIAKESLKEKTRNLAATSQKLLEKPKVIKFPKLPIAADKPEFRETENLAKKIDEAKPVEQISAPVVAENNMPEITFEPTDVPVFSPIAEAPKPEVKEEAKPEIKNGPEKLLIASNSVTTPIAINIPRWSDYSPPAPSPAPVNTRVEPAAPAPVNVAVNTQAEELKKEEMADTNKLATHILGDVNAVTYTPADTVDSPLNKVEVKKIPATHYTEAFYWTNEAVQVQVNNLTYNNVESTGWKIASTNAHWNTLYWSFSKGAEFDGGVPIIGNNTARMLAALVGNEITIGTGIVFGRIAQGWKVQLSGRSDKAIYLDSKNQLINATDKTEGERYFAILNTAPGAHLVYVTDVSNRSEGAVGIPVISGHATFMDLSDIKKETLRGHVADGRAAEYKGLKGVQVQVAGQTASAAVTKKNGQFTIGNVVTIGAYPLHIETTVAKGFTYRTRLHRSEGQLLDNVILYQMDDMQITEWVNQLEGGVSPESAVIISAVPTVVSTAEAEVLYPATKSAIEQSTLQPETYTVGADGKLRVGVPFSPATSRALSVQVPEGPVIHFVSDKNGKTIWSELVIASPRVVNVVGPY
jgi:hypothetical protein